jgi:hypothetical protein
MTAWLSPGGEDRNGQDHPWHGALDVDESAVDMLVIVFAECRELGIAISGFMPLDTPAHQRAAVMHLSRLVLREKRERGL